MRFVVNESIEVGGDPKHRIEYRFNSFTGTEEVRDNDRIIYKKNFSFGINRTFEIGAEKAKVRIKHGLLEWLQGKVLFEVNGLAVPSNGNKSKASLLWGPFISEIHDLSGAKSAIVSAITGAIISVILTFVAGFLVKRGIMPVPIETDGWVNAFLIFFLILGLLRYSRLSAILLFAYFAIAKFMLFPQLSSGQLFSFTITSVAFGMIFFQGIRGTFAYHRFKKTRISPKNIVVKGALSAGYGILFAFAGMAGFSLAAANAPTTDDSMFGFALFLPLIAGIFLTSLGFLPWSSGKPAAIESPIGD